MKLFKPLVFSALVFFNLLAFADYSGSAPSDLNSDQQYIKNFGIDSKITSNNNLTTITLLLNASTISTSIPLLREAGELNSNVSLADFSETPITTCFVWGIRASVYLIQDIYENPKINQVHLDAYLSTTDNYGNPTQKLLFKYDFNRAIYNKINWNSFDPVKVGLVAQNFKITSYFGEQMLTEEQAAN